jgi:branched-subunit amino acid ABC-type transport system permease component
LAGSCSALSKRWAQVSELTHGVFGSNYQDVFAFMVLILVLVFRPAGLLGERAGRGETI